MKVRHSINSGKFNYHIYTNRLKYIIANSARLWFKSHMHNHSLILLEAGAAIKEVQDRLGHTDVQTTMNIYAHVTKKTKAEAIQKFEKYLNI
nr:tyrosine-type recombinase/integrase [Peribacillus asahii]